MQNKIKSQVAIKKRIRGSLSINNNMPTPEKENTRNQNSDVGFEVKFKDNNQSRNF